MTDTAEVRQYAVFRVGDEEFALDIMRIKEIIRPLRVTPVPRAPDGVEGIVELRGAIIPVVDLRKRFGRDADPPTRATKYVIVAVHGHIVGLIVDAVREVIPVEPSTVRSAPALASAGEAVLFGGVFTRDGRVIMVVDADQLLTEQQRAALRAMRAGDRAAAEGGA